MNNTINLRPEDKRSSFEPPLPSERGPLFSGEKKWWKKKIVVAAAAIVIIAVIWWAWSFAAGAGAWKAVFLANNQVYFGHFVHYPFSSTITLNDVYYLQITQPSQQLSGESQSQLKLVKLGNEIHGPTSQMVIPMTQILFWETLRSDSAIVATINQAQAQTGK